MGTVFGRRTAAAVLVVGVMTMTACGDEQSPGTGSGQAASESVSPSGSATDADLEARAKSRFLPEDAFPDPWRLSQPPQPGFGLTVCGVDIEPEDPRGSARRRFAQSAVGPFLSQYVQAHRDGLADQVVSQVAEALRSCTSFETKGESPTSPTTRFTIDKVAFADVPANAVVWRMTSQGERKVTQDIALVADGEFLVGFVSYGAGPPPDPAVITTAVNALPQGD
ncbi:hypothetical protein [Knoellia subterranea]|nr:hypothetical protein [Knoellia subterranea]